MSPDTRESIARRYRFSLAPDQAPRVPGYAALLERLSSSDVAIDLLLEVPESQRNPMLVLAILHRASLVGDPRLAPLYRAIAAGEITPGAFADAVTDVLEADPDLVRRELWRTTQTNEVGRSAVLRALLVELARRGLSRVNLLDVGCSAGLNLHLDHYPVNTASGDALDLTCEVIAGPGPNGALPQIARRVGLDANPLRLEDAEDRLWLASCLWPEDRDRRVRLDRIVELRPGWEPVTLVRGGAVDGLEEALALTEPGTTTVLWHTWAAAYFGEPTQRALSARVRELVATGRVCWVYAEWPRAVAGLEPPEPTTPEPRPGGCQIVVAEPSDRPRHWGWAEAHGRWLALSPASGPKA